MNRVMRKPVFCVYENKGADLDLVGNPKDRILRGEAHIYYIYM